MNSLQDVSRIIEELGPRDEDIQSVVQRAEGAWVVRYEDLDIEAEFDEATGNVALQCELGEVPAVHRGEVYATLLKYNLIRKDTGGITMALTPGDTVVQILELQEAALTTDLLLAVLGNFTTKARILRGYVLRGPGEAAQPAPELMPFMIRV